MKVLIQNYKFATKIKNLATLISQEHVKSENPKPPVMICVLNGAFMFYSDLVRSMGIDIEVDFIRAKSYNGQDNSGGVEIIKDIEVDLKGKRVYIVDDILDTGNTLTKIVERVKLLEPADIKTITLLKRRYAKFPVDRFIFEINNEWVYGYGLDDNGLKRNYINIHYF